MAATRGRPQAVQRSGIGRIVIDKQPMVTLPELIEQHGQLVFQFRKLEQLKAARKCREPSGYHLRIFCRDPPDHVVVAGEAVSILDRQLSFAHPAQAVHSCSPDSRGTCGFAQVPAHALQQLAAAGEIQVARWHVEDSWLQTWESPRPASF